MNEQYLHNLLAIIENSGSVYSLINKGLSFSGIADLTNQAIAEGFITYLQDDVQLTEKGEQKLSELRLSLKKVDKEKWIEKDTKSMIKKLDKDFIYLPSQKEMLF